VGSPRKALGPAGLAWLAAGGLLYTVGIVFDALAGSANHYYAILCLVL
jgi:hemolysin III